jgi:mono/diheme cytochrome c family protein
MYRLDALIVAAMLLACGSARRSEPLVGPLPAHAEARLGEGVFMEHCHSCHPGGEAGLGPALNDKPLPGWAIEAQVRIGAGAMPAFSDREIDAQSLDALISYLHALRDHRGAAGIAESSR